MQMIFKNIKKWLKNIYQEPSMVVLEGNFSTQEDYYKFKDSLGYIVSNSKQMNQRENTA